MIGGTTGERIGGMTGGTTGVGTTSRIDRRRLRRAGSKDHAS